MLDGHPHVIGFIGAFLADDGLSIVQEYAEGGTLQQRLDLRREIGKHLLETEVLDTFVQLVTALQHIHSHGVLHRDLKPSNVFFDRRNLARLGDFGIAALTKYALLLFMSCSPDHSGCGWERASFTPVLSGGRGIVALHCACRNALPAHTPTLSYVPQRWSARPFGSRDASVPLPRVDRRHALRSQGGHVGTGGGAV